MADATLGPEFERLKKDVGEWDATITVTPSPGATPQESTGRLVGRLISGGRWLITDFKNHTTGFEGHGIYGYNVASKRYVGTWVDAQKASLSMAPGLHHHSQFHAVAPRLETFVAASCRRTMSSPARCGSRTSART